MTVQAGDQIHVANGGLALVAVFLPRLFDNLGWLRGPVFAAEEYKPRAVRLLHYLAHGESAPRLDEVVLNRLLCGMDDLLVDTTSSPVPEEHRAIGDGMLESVLVHWDIGTPTIDALRQSFLARRGVLDKRENHWELVVEPQAFDMLLDRLPWSIATIDLAWMDKPIHVEWR